MAAIESQSIVTLEEMGIVSLLSGNVIGLSSWGNVFASSNKGAAQGMEAIAGMVDVMAEGSTAIIRDWNTARSNESIDSKKGSNHAKSASTQRSKSKTGFMPY